MTNELRSKLIEITKPVKIKKDWELRLLHKETEKFSLEDIEYFMKKLRDSVDDVFELLIEKMESCDDEIKGIKKYIREEKKAKKSS